MGDMNFLPEDYVEKRAQGRTNAISLVLFLVVMGAIVAAFYWTDQQRVQVRDLRQNVDNQYEEAAKRLEQLDELQQRKQEMTDKAKVTAALLERVPRTLILSELINRMPSAVGLIDLDMQTRQIQGAAPGIKSKLDKIKSQQAGAATGQQVIEERQVQVSLKMIGVAPTDLEVSRFMSDLGKSPLFESLNLEFTEQTKIDGRMMRKFQVAMMVDQSVDLRQFEPTMVKRDLKHNPMDKRMRIAPGGASVLVPTKPENAPE